MTPTLASLGRAVFVYRTAQGWEISPHQRVSRSRLQAFTASGQLRLLDTPTMAFVQSGERWVPAGIYDSPDGPIALELRQVAVASA